MGINAVAIIPARGGSKRIPHKNIKSFAGKPIIAYTIVAALESGLFERVVISTDSEEVALIATEHGGEVPFLRDRKLSDDLTPVSEVILDALIQLQSCGYCFDSVAQLMPNCPLRTGRDVCESYQQFEETAADSQISVVRYGWQNPWWAMRRNKEQRLESIFPEAIASRSQDLPELFCPTGAIWWVRADVLSGARTFYVENVTGWEIPWQRGIDIDTPDDWAMAEVLKKQAQFEQ